MYDVGGWAALLFYPLFAPLSPPQKKKSKFRTKTEPVTAGADATLCLTFVSIQ